MRRFIALIAFLPLVAWGELDMVQLSLSSVITAQQQTVSATLPASGKILAIHVDVDATGTSTNTITVSTTSGRGASYEANAILTLTDYVGDGDVYYVSADAVDETGASRDGSGELAVSPFVLLGDILTLTATNTANAATNDVGARIILER